MSASSEPERQQNRQRFWRFVTTNDLTMVGSALLGVSHQPLQPEHDTRPGDQEEGENQRTGGRGDPRRVQISSTARRRRPCRRPTTASMRTATRSVQQQRDRLNRAKHGTFSSPRARAPTDTCTRDPVHFGEAFLQNMPELLELPTVCHFGVTAIAGAGRRIRGGPPSRPSW